jgi:hypothetical protein
MNYYFDPSRKALVCKFCRASFYEYASLNRHIRDKHYQIITPERVI